MKNSFLTGPCLGSSGADAQFNRNSVRLIAGRGWRRIFLLLLLALGWPLAAKAQFITMVTGDGEISITGYSGTNETMIIPEVMNGRKVTGIGYGAFRRNTNLTSVTIPDSVTSIKENAFAECSSLTTVMLGSGVASISSYAFFGCEQLASVEASPSNLVYSSAGGVLFDKARTSLIFYPSARTGHYDIPDGVTRIGANAFFGCASLASVTIPDGVASIEHDAFTGCEGLASVTIPDSVTYIGTRAFFGCVKLAAVYFQGNAPRTDLPFSGSSIFTAAPAILYYRRGTSGWSIPPLYTPFFGGRPARPWPSPQLLALEGASGGSARWVREGQFGFALAGAPERSYVVEAASSLTEPVWIPVATNSYPQGTISFSDPAWRDYPQRFYRVVDLQLRP